MKTSLLAIALVVMTGCAHYHVKQTDTSYEKGVPTRSVTTKTGATTFFDAKSTLTKFRASQTDKTQSTAVGALDSETSSQGVVSIINAAAAAAGTAGKAAVIP